MTVALIVAAGSGVRLAAGRPKALVELAGRPLYEWSLEALRSTSGVGRIALAMPARLDGAPEPAGRDHAAAAGAEVVVVPGGATRSESVRQALAAVGEGEVVLVHDAARPLLDAALAERVIAALLADPEADAAIAAAPVTDTIKRVGEASAVIETLDRDELWAVQTPQVFRRAVLERALAVPPDTLARATDDAWLVERTGGRVIVVRSGEENIKVTTPMDLRIAELLLESRSARC